MVDATPARVRCAIWRVWAAAATALPSRQLRAAGPTPLRPVAASPPSPDPERPARAPPRRVRGLNPLGEERVEGRLVGLDGLHRGDAPVDELEDQRRLRLQRRAVAAAARAVDRDDGAVAREEPDDLGAERAAGLLRQPAEVREDRGAAL